jgi:phosphoribosylanthranilate isomerase
MSNIRIWAADVNNLSDARYFAAMGVDILSFKCVNEVDLLKILAIKDWVEGPKTALEVDDMEVSSHTQHFINKLQPDIVLLSPFTEYPSLSNTIYTTTIYPDVDDIDFQIIKFSEFLNLAQFNQIRSVKHNNIFLDGPLTNEQIATITKNDPNIGIVVRGGEEIKVGIKSFDELDEFFDMVNG